VKVLTVSVAAVALVFAASSLIHLWGNLHAANAGSSAILVGANAPAEIRAKIAQKCGDCHSNNTRWPIYSRVAPSSWLVEHDVHEGREHMNLSSWTEYSVDSRIDLLGKINNQLRQGKMPMKQYLLLHPEARLSESDKKLIVDWTKAERKRLVVAAGQ